MRQAPAAGSNDLELVRVLAAWRRRTALRCALVVAVIGMLVVSLGVSGGLDLSRYAGAGPTVLHLLADSMPPDFSRSTTWIRPLFETITMSVAATLIGALVALPLALMAARNTGFPPAASIVARIVLNTSRSVPELVFGVLFVAAVGFGPLAGVLALACHSVGVLGKFVTEHVEHLDPGPAEALRSHGVSRFGIVRFCLLPQLLPRLIDLTLYRWEHNVRAASVMGMVGAGGLGLELVTAFGLFEYQEAMALLLLILLIVTVIDATSNRFRKSLVERS